MSAENTQAIQTTIRRANTDETDAIRDLALASQIRKLLLENEEPVIVEIPSTDNFVQEIEIGERFERVNEFLSQKARTSNLCSKVDSGFYFDRESNSYKMIFAIPRENK